MSTLRRFFQDSINWVRNHPGWAALIAFLWFLSTSWVDDLLSKTIWDRINQPLLQFVGNLVSRDWAVTFAPYLSFAQTAVVVGASFAAVWWIARNVGAGASSTRMQLKWFSTARKHSTDRISFIRFKEIAEQNYGWDFAHYSDQLIALGDGARQAAIDGDIMLEGRQMSRGLPDYMTGKYPLMPIPKMHLQTWWIDVLPQRNLDVVTYKPGHRTDDSENYRDLHISNEAAARGWLATKGRAFHTPQPNVDAEKALIHIAHHSVVGDRIGAKMAFEEAARDGKLAVWGSQLVRAFATVEGDDWWGAQDRIPSAYWNDGELDLGTFVLYEKPRNQAKDYAHNNMTSQKTRPKDGSGERVEIWRHLRVNKDRVLSLWPRTRHGSPLS